MNDNRLRIAKPVRDTLTSCDWTCDDCTATGKELMAAYEHVRNTDHRTTLKTTKKLQPGGKGR